jgi:hypothetical protein
MHAAEIVQSEVNVHNLILILIDLFRITRAYQGVPILFHVIFNPMPQISLQLQLIDTCIFGHVTDFNCKIPGCNLFHI